MKKPLLIILAIVAAAAVFGALGYALSSMKQSDPSEDGMEPAAAESNDAHAEASAAMAAAIDLLPDPSNVLGVRKISDNLYWAWASDPSEDGIQERSNTTWVVDTDKGDIVETFTRKEYYPMEPTIAFQPGDAYYEVDWDNGWEGTWTKTNDFFDMETGALAYTLILNQGQEAVIRSGETELSVTLDPPSECEDAVTDPSKQRVSVTGLNINGTSYPFAEPKTAACTLNELLGSGFYPEFKFINLSPSENLIRLGLPWDGAYAELPLPSLNPEQIQYK